MKGLCKVLSKGRRQKHWHRQTVLAAKGMKEAVSRVRQLSTPGQPFITGGSFTSRNLGRRNIVTSGRTSAPSKTPTY